MWVFFPLHYNAVSGSSCLLALLKDSSAVWALNENRVYSRPLAQQWVKKEMKVPGARMILVISSWSMFSPQLINAWYRRCVSNLNVYTWDVNVQYPHHAEIIKEMLPALLTKQIVMELYFGFSLRRLWLLLFFQYLSVGLHRNTLSKAV